MILDIRTWKPRHLLGAWALYWTGLVAATLGPVLASVQHVARVGGKGSFSATFGDGGFAVKVLDGTHLVRDASASFGQIAAWVALPPLALWLVWLLTRAKQPPLANSAAPLIGEGAFPADVRTAPDRDAVRRR